MSFACRLLLIFLVSAGFSVDDINDAEKDLPPYPEEDES